MQLTGWRDPFILDRPAASLRAAGLLPNDEVSIATSGDPAGNNEQQQRQPFRQPSQDVSPEEFENLQIQEQQHADRSYPTCVARPRSNSAGRTVCDSAGDCSTDAAPKSTPSAASAQSLSENVDTDGWDWRMCIGSGIQGVGGSALVYRSNRLRSGKQWGG